MKKIFGSDKERSKSPKRLMKVLSRGKRDEGASAAEAPKIVKKNAKIEFVRKLPKAVDSRKIQKQEQQIHLHTQRKHRERRENIPGKRLKLQQDVPLVKFPKTTTEAEFLDDALSDNFIFADLNEKELTLLIDAMQKQVVPQDGVIIRQGDVGDFFYVVQDGFVEFTIDGVDHPVGDCTVGESFGELALLYDAPRAATCTVTQDAILWKVDQNTFRSIMAREAHDREARVKGWLKKVPLFSSMNDAQLIKFCDALTQLRFSKGERIVNKGDIGDVFYIIAEGEVLVHDIGIGDAHSVEQTLGAGEWFGERALVTGEPRAAHVTANTDLVLEATDRETFERTFGNLKQTNPSIMDQEMKKRFLKGVPLFDANSIEDKQFDAMAKLLKEVSLPRETKLAEIGNPHDQSLWIIIRGEIIVYDNHGQVFHMQSGAYYADNSIREETTTNSKYNAECKDDTTCLVITRDEMLSVIGDMSLTSSIPEFTSSEKTGNSVTIEEIEKHRVLGCGAFGRVWLISYEGKAHALKMLSKRQLVDNDQVDGVLREKALLSTLNHPFILHLYGSFQDKEHLYLLLELVQGGELFSVIHGGRHRRGLPNGDAVFYGSCILMALAHLHQRLICYRDLKPENVLIDSDGYCVVVDLGFAKVVSNKTYTLCGTPEYLSPEIITSKGHDKAADYWAFGVLVYEMLVGRSPFYVRGADNISLFKNIVMVKYSTPRQVNGFASDLIKKLLVRNQALRLGNLSRGYRDIMEQPWFDAMNFDMLNAKEITAPWMPRVKDPYDASHFDDMAPEKERPEKPLNAKQQEFFKLF